MEALPVSPGLKHREEVRPNPGDDPSGNEFPQRREMHGRERSFDGAIVPDRVVPRAIQNFEPGAVIKSEELFNRCSVPGTPVSCL